MTGKVTVVRRRTIFTADLLIITYTYIRPGTNDWITRAPHTNKMGSGLGSCKGKGGRREGDRKRKVDKKMVLRITTVKFENGSDLGFMTALSTCDPSARQFEV